MSLHVEATVDPRGVTLDVRLPTGTVTAVVGPNGAGKSTLIHLVAGLLRPPRSRVHLDGRDVTRLPAHRRRVALLEQQPLLFPHLTVLDNVAFGAEARGAGRRAARERAHRELAAVDAAPLARRRPRTLSGGQAQRVALARALATDPDVVLLDEPFAALDVDAAAELRVLVARRLAGRTALLVTHDPLDLWSLADRVLAMQDGHVVTQGPVTEVLTRPGTGFLARLSGMNLVRGVVRGPVVRAGSVDVAGRWDPTRPAHREALAVFDPAAVALFRHPADGSPRNSWPVAVRTVVPQGHRVRVLLELDDGQPLAADLSAQGVAALAVRPGERLVAQVKAAQVTLYGRP